MEGSRGPIKSINEWHVERNAVTGGNQGYGGGASLHFTKNTTTLVAAEVITRQEPFYFLKNRHQNFLIGRSSCLEVALDASTVKYLSNCTSAH